jgi:hypothetical protein
MGANENGGKWFFSLSVVLYCMDCIDDIIQFVQGHVL